MKSLRNAWLQRTALWTAAILLVALSGSPALAEDEDLPPPGQSPNEEFPTPPPQEELPEDSLPQPGPALGDGDTLPAPSVGRESENAGNVVNPPSEDQDDIFLPTPAVQDNVNYAPLGSPVSSRTPYIDNDWRIGMDSRPIFSIHGGAAVVNYPTTAVEANRPGGTVGASIRFLNIAQTVFLHAYGSFTSVGLGNVGNFGNAKDTIFHFGSLLEVGIGRRLSLFGSLMRRNHTLSAQRDLTGQFGNLEEFAEDIVDDGWKLGLGAQWDFYVVPHGSIGLRVHAEQDLGLVAFVMALEPQPRKRLNLNFDEAK